MISAKDIEYLKRCVDLAEIALRKGDEPFGSILVSEEGEVLYEDHNQVAGGDHTQHPEFNIARWAASNLSPQERASSTVYTSGEHCPMCSAAHGWVGLGRIVYASSSKQLIQWMEKLGQEASRVRSLAIEEVIRDTLVEGPVEEFAERIFELHRESFKKKTQACSLD